MSQVQASFTLTAYATTTSEEATPDDNKVEMALQFVHQADIAMLGFVESIFKSSKGGALPIGHLKKSRHSQHVAPE